MTNYYHPSLILIFVISLFTTHLQAQDKSEELLVTHFTLNKTNPIKRVRLRKKKINALTPKIIKFTQLEVLDLTMNNLSTLPPEVGKLKNLKQLSLTSNKFTTLPSFLGKLTGLLELNVASNNFTTITRVNAFHLYYIQS